MPYSEKLMEYFRNPKNMGRIENPDGIGKVGNPVCLLPNERISIGNILLPINKIETGMNVLTHAGKNSNVVNVFKRPYKGPILSLKNKIGQISLTPEHMILGITLPKGDKYLRTKNRKILIPAWYHASELKKGDIVLYPIPQETHEISSYPVSISRKLYDYRSKKIPTNIKLNEDFLRLVGYYLSEGHCREEKYKTYIEFSFHIKEEKFAQDIKIITKKLFGLNVSIKRIPEKKTLNVFIYNCHLTRLFKNLFGAKAEVKSIPEFLMQLDFSIQKQLLIGLWRGDGYFNLHRNGPRFEYVTISENLAHQIKLLLLRQNIVSSIYKEPEKEINGVKHKNAYRIHIGQRGSIKKMCDLFNLEFSPSSYPSIDSWFDENYVFNPITGIKEDSYKGEIYNLEVEEDHSFSSEGFCLHNCGDVMWIYLKVNNDDVIEDIKFETFGCAAAIATSSVVTELAKGKKVDDALKITNKDVVEFLGGLPSIKLHCSLLAEEGLQAAIEDYRRKKQEK